MLLTVVVLLVVALAACDRVAHSYAEKTVAERLGQQSPFTSAPTITADGFPFLTQVLRGNYRHIHVNGSGLTLGDLHDVEFRADLYGVRVPLSNVLDGQVTRIPMDHAEGDVVISYAEFARLTGIKDLTITQQDGKLTVTAPVTVDIAFVHETFDVVADGTIAAAGGGKGDLALAVQNIRVAGVSLPKFAVSYISGYLNDQVTLPALPYGLTLQSVQAKDDGLHVAVAGRDLTITTD